MSNVKFAAQSLSVFAAAMLLLWLLLTMAKPMMEFGDKCREQGGVVVTPMKCLDTKELTVR